MKYIYNLKAPLVSNMYIIEYSTYSYVFMAKFIKDTEFELREVAEMNALYSTLMKNYPSIKYDFDGDNSIYFVIISDSSGRIYKFPLKYYLDEKKS